jgi:hypothetical protein
MTVSFLEAPRLYFGGRFGDEGHGHGAGRAHREILRRVCGPQWHVDGDEPGKRNGGPSGFVGSNPAVTQYAEYLSKG